MKKKDEVVEALDIVEYQLEDLEYRRRQRSQRLKTLCGIYGGLIVVDIIGFVLLSQWEHLVPTGIGILFAMSIAITVLAFPFVAAWLIGSLSLGSGKDRVHEQLLIRERRKLLDATEVRGALQVHAEVPETAGALTLEGASGGLSPVSKDPDIR